VYKIDYKMQANE